MIRIAITGPESSGKTTLCKALAAYYGVGYIPEYARTYLEKTKGKYEQSDLDHIARGQYDNLINAPGDLLICDTDFHVIEVWSAYKYESVSSYISLLLQEDLFDLHILCKPDIPWDPDPLRENPEDRDFLFERYIAALEKHHKNYIIVEGSSDKRIEKSIKSIHRIQNK